MKTIEVVAAVIFDGQGRIFATQRGYGEWKDWWEFPGGKMEPGETPQEALKREIREELDAEIDVGDLLRTIDYDYPSFHLTMHCFKCRLKQQSSQNNAQEPWNKEQELRNKEQAPRNKTQAERGKAQGHGYILLEHEAAKWLKPNKLQTVTWLPADEEIITDLKR